MLQNVDLNIPMKWENVEIDPAVHDFATQGFSLMLSIGSLAGAQSIYKHRKKMEYEEEREGRKFLFSWSVPPSYLSNYYFKDIFFTLWDAAKQIATKQNFFSYSLDTWTLHFLIDPNSPELSSYRNILFLVFLAQEITHRSGFCTSVDGSNHASC